MEGYMNTFSDFVEEIDKLSLDEQESFVDILQKRIAEEKRKRFVEEALESKEEFEKGSYSEGSSADLFKALNI